MLKNKKWRWLLLLPLTLLLIKCGDKKVDDGGPGDDPPNIYQSEITLPKNGATFTAGKEVPVKIIYKDGGKTLENLTLWLDDKKIFTSAEQKAEFNITIHPDSIGLGTHTIKAESKIKGNDYFESFPINVRVLSDLVPEQYTYKVVNKYPHDTKAFTEGLYIENGLMYEGTGHKGQSELRQLDFRQNKVLKKTDLDANLFGEGIAQAGDKIYQLTYTTNIGFIYDKNTFKQVGQFTYPTQGWGLTFDGTYLIMSDGSQYLSYYEPETFKFVKKMGVANNVSEVVQLNELEYINGEIWANVWMTSNIVVIDAATGKVKRTIDFSGLLTPAEELQSNADVLNGIAYDKDTKKLYVTGKYWPWLFEVTVEKKQPE